MRWRRCPSTTAYVPDQKSHSDYVPTVAGDPDPAGAGAGAALCPADPLRAERRGPGRYTTRQAQPRVRQYGKAGACFHVRSAVGSVGPWSYTVEAGKTLSDVWNVSGNSQGSYDLTVYGPNGFLRHFKGSAAGAGNADVDVDANYDRARNGLELVVTNRAWRPAR